MPSILIVDMQRLFAYGLKTLAEEALPTSKIDIGQSRVPIMQALEQGRYDVLVLDVFGEGRIVPDLIGKLTHRFPRLKILVLCNPSERGYIGDYFRKGITGYIERSISATEFQTAIKMVSQGNIFLQAEFLLLLLSEKEILKNTKENNKGKLTVREQQIATLMLTGKTQTAICKKLGLSPSTISTHKIRIYKKLDVNNLIDLMRKAENCNIDILPEKYKRAKELNLKHPAA